jgi:hypothetical protein
VVGYDFEKFNSFAASGWVPDGLEGNVAKAAEYSALQRGGASGAEDDMEREAAGCKTKSIQQGGYKKDRRTIAELFINERR